MGRAPGIPSKLHDLWQNARMAGSAPATAPRARFYRRHPRLVLGGLLLVMIPALDLSATAVLRWTGIYRPPAGREDVFRRPDPVYHHGLRAAVTADAAASWGRRNYSLYTNSLGFKDASPRQVSLRREGRRLLFLGDSFTEGIGVEYPQTFVGLLDAQRKSEGVEVLNAGVASYSPAIYLAKTRHLIETVGLEFDHLVLGLDVSDIVDELQYEREGMDGTKLVRKRRASDSVKEFIRRNTILIQGLRNGWRYVREGWLEPQVVFGHEKSSWTSDADQFDAVGRPGLALAEKHLTELRSLLRSKGIGMTLVVYPWPDQVRRQERDCPHVAHWREWCAAQAVDFVDLFPVFLDSGDSEQVIEQYFIPGDMHWNEAGHALVAEQVGKRLPFAP